MPKTPEELNLLSADEHGQIKTLNDAMDWYLTEQWRGGEIYFPSPIIDQLNALRPQARAAFEKQWEQAGWVVIHDNSAKNEQMFGVKPK